MVGACGVILGGKIVHVAEHSASRNHVARAAGAALAVFFASSASPARHHSNQSIAEALFCDGISM